MKRTLVLAVTIVMSIAAFAQTSDNRLTIGVRDSIISKQLSETRYLNIYLPVGYSDTERYNVIYLLDGGMNEDFIHVVGLMQFNTMPWINRVPRSIVVGIVNVDRQRDMTYPTTVAADKKRFPATGGSEKFISFIETELQPYIQQHYHTNGNNMLIGQSLGGLVATEILFKKPQLFNKYLIMSPSLWWDAGSLLNYQPIITKNYPTTDIDIYLAVGKEGLTPTEPARVMEVDANLLAEKINNIGNVHIRLSFDYLPDENHATINHQAVFRGFRSLYPANKN